jgi:hypothetical protein
VVKANRLLVALDQLFVQKIEHLQKGLVRAHIVNVVFDELARGLGIFLPPDA